MLPAQPAPADKVGEHLSAKGADIFSGVGGEQTRATERDNLGLHLSIQTQLLENANV